MIKNKAAVVSGFLLLGFVFLVIFGPIFSSHQYDELDFESKITSEISKTSLQ